MVRSAASVLFVSLFLACSGAPSASNSSSTSQALGSCNQPSMFLIGSPRNYAQALQMTCVNGAWEVDELFAGTGNVFAAGAFKFVQNGTFNGPNWGDNRPADGIADPGGDENDIVVQTPGTYTVRFNDQTLRYDLIRKPSSCAQPSMFARGSFNGWGRQQMFCVDQGKWAAIVMFIGNAEHYKFDALGDWSTNWGDSNGDGIADPGGSDIAAPGSGRYLVTFDENSLAYVLRFISPSCSRPSMFIRAANNGWQPVAMECENGHYAINLDAGSGTQYKFDAFGDWSLNWGDNNGDFQADQNGANIPLVGRHHIHFYNDARYAYDTHQ
jgi:hypothetical protein